MSDTASDSTVDELPNKVNVNIALGGPRSCYNSVLDTLYVHIPGVVHGRPSSSSNSSSNFQTAHPPSLTEPAKRLVYL